ncbi:hypothetical protein ACHQM5_012834 [Ranunculus cassubicifolius]
MDEAKPPGGLVQSLNAKVYGNGSETVVLAHDLMRHFKVVVYDLAFSAKVESHVYDPKKYSSYYGYAEDLQNLLDELHLENIIFIGHSMASMIGFINDKDYNGGFESSDTEEVFAAMKQDFSGWCPNFAAAIVGTNDSSAVEVYTESLASMEPDIALDVARAVFLCDYRNILEEVKVPCTIIQSEKDIDVPLSVVHYMKRKLGDYAKVEIMETEGHLPMLTAHAMLLEVLKRVLSLN